MTRKYRIPAILILTLLLQAPLLMAGGPAEPDQVKGDMAATEQAWTLIGAGALLIDVRSAREFQGGHLEGAVNIPHTQIDELAEFIGDDRARPAVLYCRSGRRSGLATKALQELGYTAVFNGTGYEALSRTRP